MIAGIENARQMKLVNNKNNISFEMDRRRRKFGKRKERSYEEE